MKKVNKFIAQTIILFITSISAAQSEIISEDFLLMNDSIQLPGTLTYNKELKQQPLIIFVQGSGNPDRNGNQPAFGVNINYIKLLRDKLNKNGFAFYSYDKRNVTPSNIKHILKSFVFKDLADDAKKAIENFESDERFNQIIIIGHSQGSLVAMLAANENVDKYISLAGLSESVDKAITRQVTGQSKVLGEVTARHFKELSETGKIKEVNPQLLSIFAKPNLPFFKSYLKYDPKEEINKLNMPCLIINGTKDIQVEIEDAKKLHKAKPEAQLSIIENMNHVLKIITKDEDNLKSYSSPDFPLSEELVNVITEFIKK